MFMTKKINFLTNANHNSKKKSLVEILFNCTSIPPFLFVFVLYAGYFFFNNKTSLSTSKIFITAMVLGFYSLLVGVILFLYLYLKREMVFDFYVKLFFFDIIIWAIIWFFDPFNILGFVLD